MHAVILSDLDPVSTIMTVVGLGFLIFFHELGHFLACRVTGTRVEAFSIGFGKEIVGWTRGHTRYRVGIIPLGGYVKMAAENPGDVGTGAPDEFPNKSFSQRLLIMSAGVLFNMLLAFILFVVAFGHGVQFMKAEVGAVEPGSSAWRAGIRAGDVITHIDDTAVLSFTDLSMEVALAGDRALLLAVERDGETLQVPVRAEYNEELGARVLGLLRASTPAALEVQADSPVARAGGRVGDVPVAVNGQPVRNLVEASQACQRASLRAGAGVDEIPVALRVRRADGAEEDLEVKLPLGTARQIGIVPYSGRRVTAIARGQPLSELLREGDDVMSANGETIADLASFDSTAGAEALSELVIQRDGKEMRVAVPAGLTVLDLAQTVAGTRTMGAAIVSPRRGMPAEKAGIRAGDTVLSVSDTPVQTFAELGRAIVEHEEGPVTLEVKRRDGETETITVIPGRLPEPLGYSTGPVMVTYKETSVLSALGTGWNRTVVSMKTIFATIKSLLTGGISSNQIGGPIMLAQVTYSMWDQGLGRYLYILALLSVNLAILNILPIPILDGGQIVLLCAEKLRGKPMPERVVGYYQMVGLVLILGLMFLAFKNDITRWLQ